MSQDGICWGLHGEGGAWWMLWPCHGCCYIVLKKKATKKNGVSVTVDKFMMRQNQKEDNTGGRQQQRLTMTETDNAAA
jgi:hypothetical protein